MTVTAEDPAEMIPGLSWARLAYEHLADNQGQKENQPRNQGQQEEETPICAVHQVPMFSQEGKHGSFWSCHQRNEDGSFCSYKPVRC